MEAATNFSIYLVVILLIITAIITIFMIVISFYNGGITTRRNLPVRYTRTSPARELKATDFEEHTTAARLDLTGVKYGSSLHLIIKRLNSSRIYCKAVPESYMDYGVICGCDDSFLCEHRLQWLVNFLKGMI